MQHLFFKTIQDLQDINAMNNRLSLECIGLIL